MTSEQAGILIVDDEPPMRELIGQVFKLDGRYQVLGSAATADVAVEFLENTQPPDPPARLVVILDSLAQGSASELPEAARVARTAQEVWKALVVGFSGSGSLGARGVPVNADLSKPSDIIELPNIVSSLLAANPENN